MTAAHDDYFTTPTPGDLSARLLACAKDCDVYSPDQCATLIDGIGWISMRELLTEAAAALSALPAAGGVVAEVCMDQSGCKYLCWSPGLEELPAVGTKLYTTPQPSAAEGAAVGEQGDGEPQDPDKVRIGILHTGKLGDAFPQDAATVRAALTRQPVAGDERVNVDHLRAIACEVENHRPQGHPSYGKYIVSEQFVRAAEKLAKMARNTDAPAATSTDS